LANSIIKTYDKALDKMETFKKGFTANLQIGILYYAVNRYLSPILNEFKVTYPNVNINIFPSYPAPVIEGLINGNTTWGLYWKRSLLGMKGLSFKKSSENQLL
jgi:DNA-binding transcriptional LysR family regulator